MKNRQFIIAIFIFILCVFLCSCKENETALAQNAIKDCIFAYEEQFGQNGVIPENELYIYEKSSFVDITIDSGILDFKPKKIDIVDNTATAEATFVGWDTRIKCIEAEKKYAVYMTMSKYRCSYELSLENDIWYISDTGSRLQEFAPDFYNYEKGQYQTFEEAVFAAKELDPEKENPF